MENLECYIIRMSFFQERMQYLDQEGKVIYMPLLCLTLFHSADKIRTVMKGKILFFSSFF